MPGIVERLHDGFPTTISLTGAGVTFWEKTAKPGGFDGGEPIDITTMRNATIRTKAPRHLYDVTPMTLKVAYDPTVETTIKNAINANQEIVTTYPDSAATTWWGWLKSFEPDELTEGTMPTATITLIHSGYNASGVETVPVTVAGSGTGA
jgi:hypothetical protein